MAVKRKYRVGGHVFAVVLEEPWTLRPLSDTERALAERLRRGGDIGIEPVPADQMELLAENARRAGKSAGGLSGGSLDFAQYAPFEVGEGDPLFTFTVGGALPAELADRSAWRPVVSVHEALPYYDGYTCGDWVVYEYFPAADVLAGTFVMRSDGRSGRYLPCDGIGPRTTLLQVNTSLMIQYTHATAGLDTLLLHASVVRETGQANLFFGVSGTGKSTHSRLWLAEVPGCDLLNDDNPVVRLTDGGPVVHGTPWSGKTLCYRNVSAPVRALVRLEQASVNAIARLSPLDAYGSVLAATSTIRWRRTVMDHLVPVIERLALAVPCWRLACRPDPEAVRLCRSAIMHPLS